MSINCAKKKASSELSVVTGEKKHRKKKNVKKKVRSKLVGSADVNNEITVLGKELSLIPLTCRASCLTKSCLTTSTNVKNPVCQLRLASSVNQERQKHSAFSSSQSLCEVSQKEVSCYDTKSGLSHSDRHQGCNSSTAGRAQSCLTQPFNWKGAKKTVPLLTAIKPENEKSEKERFFQAKFLYNPVFVYRNQVDMDALERFSCPSDKHLPQAILIMERALEKHGHYEQFEENTGGKVLNRPEIVSIIKRYLRQEDLEDEIRLNLSEDLLSRASMTKGKGKATLNVRIVNLREFWVEGLLRHEIGTHYLRSCNNKHQVWYNWKKRKDLGLKHFNPTEEGLASLHSVLLRKDPCLWRSALLYYTAYKAAYLSFKDLFRDLGKFVSDAHVRWDYCMRAKRGQGDTSIPVGDTENSEASEDIQEWFDANESKEDWFTLPSCNALSEDLPLYPGAPITVAASLLIILNLAFFHGLTGECLKDILVAMSLHFIQPNNCLTSLYKFRQFFQHLRNPLGIHKFCNTCSYAVVMAATGKCVVCDKPLENNVSYFIEIPLAKQLIDLFGRQGFYEDLQHRFTKKKKHPNNIEDIYDGRLYQEHCSPGGFLHEKNNISLMWYTDGVPLFHSSQFSIWPVCFTINELPYAKRTRTENILMGGLWFGESKPCMLAFWEPIAKNLKDLQQTGVEVTVPSATMPFNVRASVLCGTCDLPAKCIMLNMIQFNGKHGCAKCLQPGQSVSTGKGSVWTFPFDSENIDGPKRNHADTLNHARSAHESNQNVYGIKGPSWLGYVQQDLIRGTTIDFMHTGLLGIVRRLLTLWFDSSFSKEMFSISKFIDEVDTKLLSIKPPNFISRIPRSIARHRKYWKASECRSWLYYYSLPILLNIMETDYLEHHMLLVEAAYTLNLVSISPEQLHHCHKLLVQYVCMFSALYGERHMSANIHQLLHLVETVRDVGPLWVYSCFPLEDFNGRLLKLFHGTQHPELQIVGAVATLAKLPSLNRDYINHPLIGCLLRKFSKVQGVSLDIKLSGKLSLKCLPKELEMEITATMNALSSDQPYFLYSRLHKTALVVPSRSCKLVQKRISYTVKCMLNKSVVIGEIELYIKKFLCRCINVSHDHKCDHEILALLRELKTEPVHSQ